MPTVFPRSGEIASRYAELFSLSPSEDAAEPAVLILRTAVLDVLQPLTNREGGLAARTRADLVAARLVFQHADRGDATAAVPQAKSSVTFPDPIPSSNSSTPIRRSTGVSPNSAASVKIESRVTPSRIEPVSSGVINSLSVVIR